MVTREEMVAELQQLGWELDRFGYLKKELKGRLYRYKMQARSWRKEVKHSMGWVKLHGAYYSETVRKNAKSS